LQRSFSSKDLVLHAVRKTAPDLTELPLSKPAKKQPTSTKKKKKEEEEEEENEEEEDDEEEAPKRKRASKASDLLASTYSCMAGFPADTPFPPPFLAAATTATTTTVLLEHDERRSSTSKSSIKHRSLAEKDKERDQDALQQHQHQHQHQHQQQEELAFTVFGEPTPLSRHRVAGMHMYNPSAKQQKLFALSCQKHMPESPLEGPLAAHMAFYFSRPKSHYRSGKYANELKPHQDHWHSKRKDLDNLIKFVLDSLNEKAFLDDSQIVTIVSSKQYTEDKPRTEVYFRSLPPPPPYPNSYSPTTSPPQPAPVRKTGTTNSPKKKEAAS